jgi:antitoxin HicB
MYYPVRLERDDNNTILVSFLDFPEAHTFGDTREEALRRASDALATVLDAYIKDRRAIPLPSVADGAIVVKVPALIEAKVQLYDVMRQDRVGKTELARRLKWHLPQVDRLLNVHHGSRLDQLESAFSALGKRIVVSVQDVTSPRTKETAVRVGRGAKGTRRRHAGKAKA